MNYALPLRVYFFGASQKQRKQAKKIHLKGQGDRVIQSEDNENMNLGVDIPRGGSSCPLFPGQVDFGNVKIFWRVGNRRTYIYITKSTYFLHLSCSGQQSQELLSFLEEKKN